MTALELVLGRDAAFGYLAIRGSSSWGYVILWRPLSGGLKTIVPSCVQQTATPKCCRAKPKFVGRIYVRNFLTVQPDPVNPVFAFQTTARTSAEENRTSTGRWRSLEEVPMR